MAYTTLPGDFGIALVQKCRHCDGTGWVRATYCAANDLGTPFHVTESLLTSGAAAPPVEACRECIKGFRFIELETRALLPFLLRQLVGDEEAGKQLLALVVAATERQVGGSE